MNEEQNYEKAKTILMKNPLDRSIFPIKNNWVFFHELQRNSA